MPGGGTRPYNTGLQPFEPLFTNPHAQTIAGRYWPRPTGVDRFPVTTRLYQTEPDVRILVEAQRPAGEARGQVVLVHGLEGSANAVYMRSFAARALEAGYTAHRVNLRSCGGTERYATSVYHGGLTTDLLFILRTLAKEGVPVWLVGFSLGGNVVAKLAGELGEEARSLLAGVVGASAAIDLEACAIRIGQRENRIYETRFLSLMRQRARSMWRIPRSELRRIRTLIEMDDRITAPRIGFDSALHYYRTQSASRFLQRIQVPTLFVTSEDDPLIPFETYDHPAFRENRCLQLVATKHGGHLGFLAKRRPRIWLDDAILKWIARSGTIHPPHSSGY